MYKLLLVDDEEDVREGLLQEMNWEQCGFQVVGIAENGREAMECMERLRPDVVVTDIQMPFMNGLQLAEWIRVTEPTTKIVILTGYDEFDYAQKAIRLSIDEYILKPFSAQELMAVLDKVRTKMDEEAAHRDNVQELQEHMRRSLPILREVFLRSLLTEPMTAREIAEKIDAYDVPLSGQQFRIAVISLEAESAEQAAARVPSEHSLKRYAAYNVADELLARDDLGIALIHNDEIVIIGMDTSMRLAEQPFHAKFMGSCEEIRQSILRYVKVGVTIGIGVQVTQLSELSRSYQDARHALDYRMVLGTERLIYIDDVEARPPAQLRFEELQERALLRCLKVGTEVELKDTMNELFSSMSDSQESQLNISDVHIYLMEMLLTVMKVARDTGVDLEAAAQQWNLSAPRESNRTAGSNLFDEVRQLRHAGEAQRWMTDLCAHLMRHIVKDRQTSYQRLVEDAKAYVQLHYADSEMSINKVCAQLHISAGYFSGIFKKETKMTFVHYLLHLRMEQAKELLRTTDYKTFEIAERVGYMDANYFSYSFKKHMGQSPKEYRNGLGLG